MSIGTIDLTALETTQETYDSSSQESIIESSTGNGHDGSGLDDISISSVQTFAVDDKNRILDHSQTVKFTFEHVLDSTSKEVQTSHLTP